MSDDVEIQGNAGAEAHSVDDVFNDSVPEAAVEPESQGEPVAAKSESAEVTATEAVPPAAEDIKGLRAALLDERRKRQALESKQEAKRIPDPIEDPEGYANHIDARAQQSEFKTRIAISRDLMVDSHPDFEDAERVFMGLVADADGNITDESLFRKFQAAPNPARFAYNAAKEHLQVQEIKSPAYRDKLKAEIRAELEAEMKGKRGATVPKIPDLVGSTAAGSNSSEVERLPEIDEIFAGAKF